MYICNRHKIEIENGVECIYCREAYNNLPAVDTMTRQEQVDEFNKWTSDWEQVTIDWESMKNRISDLIGRPIFVHELLPDNWEDIRLEILTGIEATDQEIIDRVPKHIKLISVDENMHIQQRGEDGEMYNLESGDDE